MAPLVCSLILPTIAGVLVGLAFYLYARKDAKKRIEEMGVQAESMKKSAESLGRLLEYPHPEAREG